MSSPNTSHSVESYEDRWHREKKNREFDERILAKREGKQWYPRDWHLRLAAGDRSFLDDTLPNSDLSDSDDSEPEEGEVPEKSILDVNRDSAIWGARTKTSEHTMKKTKCGRKGEDRSDQPDQVGQTEENPLMKEVLSLREELKCIHQISRKMQDELIEVEEEKDKYHHLWIKVSREAGQIWSENDMLVEEIDGMKLTNDDLLDSIQRHTNDVSGLQHSREEWIGRTLKFQYLFQQMEKIGLKQSEDIFDAFQDIEVPEVSINVKDKFVPTSQTDNIDWFEEEDLDLSDSDDELSEPDIIGWMVPTPSDAEIDAGIDAEIDAVRDEVVRVLQDHLQVNEDDEDDEDDE
jgi:hypothetical protein